MKDEAPGGGSRMMTGFNHNLKYKDKVYHVQTEDGGRGNPHLVTHLFIGGVILDTLRSSYADLLDRPDAAEAIRERMRAQHLEAIRRLYAGLFDPPGGQAGS